MENGDREVCRFMEGRFSIDDCLGFIANRLVRVFQKAVDKRVMDHGLTTAQFCVLAKLSEEEGITQTELAGRLFIENPTLVRTLDRMESSGIIERRRDPRDRRAYHIYLLPKGRELMDLVERVGQEVHQTATRDLAQEELLSLKNALYKIWHNLSEDAEQG